MVIRLAKKSKNIVNKFLSLATDTVVEEGTKNNCPYCGKKTSNVDVLEEILEFAERTDADIEFTDDEEISKLGHVGAILRFKSDS